MIFSMTGYGRKEFPLGDKNVIIEIKSLNGKQLDINCKLSPLLKPFETEIRKKIQELLVRGTIDCSIQIIQAGTSKPLQLNTSLLKNYYESVQNLATELALPTDNILGQLLQLPEVVSIETGVLQAEDWAVIQKDLVAVLEELRQFRSEEGKGLEKDLLLRVHRIIALQQKVESLDGDRNERIRQRILKSLQQVSDEVQIDANRLEQELIYYIEKIDISEEKQRLAQHCELFEKTILSAGPDGTGKKLNFILQEMGREINTMGSKAYDASIQKIVIDMKDELEKAKEQSLNVL